MKRLFSLATVSLSFAITALSGSTLSGGQNRDVEAGMRDRFVGAWRLAWLEEEGADGRIRKADCSGLLVCTRDGHMSVQVMHRDPQANPQSATME